MRIEDQIPVGPIEPGCLCDSCVHDVYGRESLGTGATTPAQEVHHARPRPELPGHAQPAEAVRGGDPAREATPPVGRPHASKRGDEGTDLDASRVTQLIDQYEVRYGRMPEWKRELVHRMIRQPDNVPFLIAPPQYRSLAEHVHAEHQRLLELYEQSIYGKATPLTRADLGNP